MIFASYWFKNKLYKEFTARNVTQSKSAKCLIEPQNNCIEGI